MGPVADQNSYLKSPINLSHTLALLIIGLGESQNEPRPHDNNQFTFTTESEEMFL